MSPPRLPVRLGLVVVLLCVVCSGSASSTDDLSPPPHTTETLHLDATADGAVVAKFEFTFSHPYHGTPGMPAAAQHRLFRFVGGGRRMPAGLAAVVNTHHVHELALSLAAGVWDDAWGVAPAPAGAQLQLWLGTTQTTTTATATTSQDSSYAARVSHIVESLSALYCASIGLLRPQDFVSPLSTPARPVFAPRSPQLWRPCDDDDSSSPSRRLSRSRTGRAHRALCPVSPLHATLPREGLCTENLTPMLRMLPCRAEAGLATLLNPLMLFASEYHALGVNVFQQCADGSTSHPSCQDRVFVVQHTFTVVLRPSSSEWSVSTLFRRHLTSTCALSRPPVVSLRHLSRTRPSASSEDDTVPVQVLAPRNVSLAPYESYRITLPHSAANGDAAARGDSASAEVASDPESPAVVNAVSPARPLDLRVRVTGTPTTATATATSTSAAMHAAPSAAAPLRVRRYLTGSGFVRRGVGTSVHVAAESGFTNVTLFETLPWVLRPVLHTHRVEVVCDAPADASVPPAPVWASRHVQDYAVDPSSLYGHPTTIVSTVTVPPRCTVHLWLECDLAFLSMEDFPADPARGFDIPAAVAWLQNSSTHREARYSRTMLVDVPTPDFSMPYNVITFTCSVATFLIGSMFNLLARKRRQNQHLVVADGGKPIVQRKQCCRRCARRDKNK